MNCEKFLNWLDETEPNMLSSNLPDDIKSHIDTCKTCREQLNAQTKAISLLVGLGPSAEATNRIIEATTNHISANYSPQLNTTSISDRLANLFRAYSWQFAGGLALVIVMYFTTAAIFPKNMLVSGNGTIVRIAKQTDLKGTIVKILPSDRLVLNNQTAMVVLQNQDCIEITGTGDFTFSNRNIHMKKGSAELQFSPSILGYKVKLNKISVTVVGTVLKLETNTISDSILVTEGKVTWKSLDKQNSGTLVKDQGIKTLNGAYSKISNQKSITPIMMKQNQTKHGSEIVDPTSEAEPVIPGNN